MQTFAHHSAEVRQGASAEKFPPLEQVTRSHVPTEQAAYYLSRRPQTLRSWSMTGKVLQPLRINGRLAWPVAGIKALVGLA